jgi:predicted permease
VLCGYIASRSGFLERIHIAGLSKFTFYISVPSFLFLNMAKADLQTSVSLNGFLSFSGLADYYCRIRRANDGHYFYDHYLS